MLHDNSMPRGACKAMTTAAICLVNDAPECLVPTICSILVGHGKAQSVCLAPEMRFSLLCRPNLTSPTFYMRSPLGWWAFLQSPSKGQKSTVSILSAASRDRQAGKACQQHGCWWLGGLLLSSISAQQQAAIKKQLILHVGPCPQCMLCNQQER